MRFIILDSEFEASIQDSMRFKELEVFQTLLWKHVLAGATHWPRG